MGHWTLCVVGFVVAVALAAPRCTAVDLKDANVQVTLEGGVARDAEHRGNLTLEFQVRGGQWQKDWVFARGMTQGRHTGKLKTAQTNAGADVLTLDLHVKPDLWAGGGLGSYTLTLKPGADGALEGAYEGTFTPTVEPKPIAPRRTARVAPGATPATETATAPATETAAADAPETPPPPAFKTAAAPAAGTTAAPAPGDAIKVSGTARVKVRAAWPEPVAGFTPVAPGEHPRLIFRKADVAQLRQRAETPEGKAIMERFLQVLDYKAHNVGYKVDSWPGIGFGFAYQMTGDQKYAQRAKELIQQKFFERAAMGGQDIHHAPQLQGLALTFDLCYDAWDQAFRQQCIDELWQRTQECHTGTFGSGGMGGTNWAYWSNHNGIRAGAAGLGALALLHEKHSNGHVFGDDVCEIADITAYDERGWLEDGCGGGQWFMEGVFYKGMTMVRGLAHFNHAYKVATGQKVNQAGLRDDLITGYFLEAAPGKLFGETSGIDEDDLVEVIWTIGLSEVPASAMPGVKYLLNRNVGMEGNKTFGLARAPYAAYLMACYPFDVQEKPPAECFPWLSPDPSNGHWVFRNTYNDAKDILLTWNLLSGVRGSCHNERVGKPAEWVLYGLGQQWFNGTYHPAIAGKEKCLGDKSGPLTLAWKAENRVAAVKFDLAPAYMTTLTRPRNSTASMDELAKAAGAQGAGSNGVWNGGLADFGIRGTRHVVVDLSGVSGAPFLMVIAEDLQVRPAVGAPLQPAQFTWQLPLAAARGAPTVDGQVLKLAGANATLTCLVLGATPGAKGECAVKDGKLLAVITLQEGAGLAPKAEGNSVDAKVTVGKRTVRWASDKLLVE